MIIRKEKGELIKMNKNRNEKVEVSLWFERI